MKIWKRFFLISSVFILFYITDVAIFSTLYHSIDSMINVYPISFFIAYLIVGLPIFIYFQFAVEHHFFTAAGLHKNFFFGIFAAFLFASPMLLGYGFLSNFEIDLSGRDFWFGCVFAALFEELYYRSFFFGELYKKTHLGFILSLTISALIFASLHLYQSTDPAVLTGIFITTFLGAALFSWLYVEWNFNLWIPIGLHFFMNLSWGLFSVSDNAFGDLTANLVRAITILFAIVGTIIYKRREGISLTINRDTVWMKKIEN